MKSIRLIATIMFLGGINNLMLAPIFIDKLTSGPFFLKLVLLFYFILNVGAIISGIGLWLKKSVVYKATLVILAITSIAFVLGPLSFSSYFLAGLYFLIDSTSNMGFEFKGGFSNFEFMIAKESHTVQSIKINLISLISLIILWKNHEIS